MFDHLFHQSTDAEDRIKEQVSDQFFRETLDLAIASSNQYHINKVLLRSLLSRMAGMHPSVISPFEISETGYVSMRYHIAQTATTASPLEHAALLAVLACSQMNLMGTQIKVSGLIEHIADAEASVRSGIHVSLPDDKTLEDLVEAMRSADTGQSRAEYVQALDDFEAALTFIERYSFEL